MLDHSHGVCIMHLSGARLITARRKLSGLHHEGPTSSTFVRRNKKCQEKTLKNISYRFQIHPLVHAPLFQALKIDRSAQKHTADFRNPFFNGLTHKKPQNGFPQIIGKTLKPSNTSRGAKNQSKPRNCEKKNQKQSNPGVCFSTKAATNSCLPCFMLAEPISVLIRHAAR